MRDFLLNQEKVSSVFAIALINKIKKGQNGQAMPNPDWLLSWAFTERYGRWVVGGGADNFSEERVSEGIFLRHPTAAQQV